MKNFPFVERENNFCLRSPEKVLSSKSVRRLRSHRKYVDTWRNRRGEMVSTRLRDDLTQDHLTLQCNLRAWALFALDRSLHDSAEAGEARGGLKRSRDASHPAAIQGASWFSS